MNVLCCICVSGCLLFMVGSSCSNAAPPQVTNPLLDSMRTRSIAEPYPDSNNGTVPMPHTTDTGKRKFKGTREDSMRTEVNPYYKGDNSDTGRSS